jgi:16S rRNA processing protein RimM
MTGRRPDRVRLGTAGKAHGLDGTFLVDAPCGWFAFATGSVVLVDGVAHRVRRRAGTDGRPLVALDGIDSREGAEALRGRPIEIDGADLPPAEEGAYFRFDLVGCEVFQGETLLGVVTAVEDGVAHDVLLLESDVRLPFVEAVVPVVDIDARRIEIDPGLDLG